MAITVKDETPKKKASTSKTTTKEAASKLTTTTEVPEPKNLFGSIISGSYRSLSLGAEGTRYVEAIRKELQDSGVSGISITNLSRPNNSLLFHKDNKGFIVTFQESISFVNSNVSRDYTFRQAAKAATATKPDMLILDIVTMEPESYSKPSQMVKHIINTLTSAINEDYSNLSLRTVGAYGQYRVDINIDQVHNYIDAVSPHGVRARADVGLLVYQSKHRQNPMYGRADRFEDEQPIAAITGYTEIVQSNSVNSMRQTKPFLPCVHITDIVSEHQIPQLTPLLISLFLDVFISKQNWRKQFGTFEKGGVNLGHLLQDVKTGKTEEFTNVEQRDNFIAMHCEPPCAILDVTDGRCRQLGLGDYIENNTQHELIKQYSKFFGEEFNPTAQVTTYGMSQVNGVVRQGSKAFDSRCMDYLTLFPKVKNDTVKPFLVLHQNPKIRSEWLAAQHGSNYSEIYITHYCIIDPNIAQICANKVATELKLASSIRGDANLFNTGVLIDQAHAFGKFNFNVLNDSGNYMGGNMNWRNRGNGYYYA